MSDRIAEICLNLTHLKRKREELEEELHQLQEKKLKDILNSLSHVPLDLTDAAAAWKSGKVTCEEVSRLWDLKWGQCHPADSDFFTFKGRNVCDLICDDMLDEIPDSMAEIYFDLKTVRFVGPFQYDSEEEQEEAVKWRECDSAFCAFAK